MRSLVPALFVSAALLGAGCSDEAKKVEPKLAPGTTPDARLQPEGMSGSSPAAQSPAVKGD